MVSPSVGLVGYTSRLQRLGKLHRLSTALQRLIKSQIVRNHNEIMPLDISLDQTRIYYRLRRDE